MIGRCMRTIAAHERPGPSAKAQTGEMIDNEITGIDVGMTPTEV